MLNLGRCRLFADDLPGYSVRAIDLVTQSDVIDMLGLLTMNWQLLDKWRRRPETFGAPDFRKLRSSGIDVFHPAVALECPRAYAVTRQLFADWNAFIAHHPQYFLRVDTPADLARARSEHRIGIILGTQDANHIRALADLDEFYSMGQRVTQLTYNAANTLGYGCLGGADKGLTEFGRAVVARMNSIGMAVDVSHCGERTTMDAVAASKKPVLITHSNCRALALAARCKPDEAIRAAARAGSVFGVTCVRHFVRAKDPVTIEDLLDHFDYITKLVGIEHVGVGSDTDLDGRDSVPGHLRYDIAGLNHPRRMYDLTEGLIRRGYTDRHIESILGGNFKRVLGEIWTS